MELEPAAWRQGRAPGCNLPSAQIFSRSGPLVSTHADFRAAVGLSNRFQLVYGAGDERPLTKIELLLTPDF